MGKERIETVDVLEENDGDSSAMLQMLLDIQRRHSWLPAEALLQVSSRLNVPLTQIYQAATFYKAFSLEPRGKYTIAVCTGTACHVRGAPALLDSVSRLLGVRHGGTTRDGLFTLETVNCMGCCALGPVLAIDDKHYSNPPGAELEGIVAGFN